MRKVTVEELKQMASDQRLAVWSQAESVGREPKVYLHWTAGHYFQKFADYHINITADGAIWLMTEDLSEVLAHTWKRNTGSIGVTLCCAAGATTNDLGDEPPTEDQINAMAKVTTALCDGLWLTIDKNHVMTHGEAAANEDGLHPHPAYAVWEDECGDGQVRWDLEYLGTDESPEYAPWALDGSRGGDVLRGKAQWYRDRKLV